MSDIGDKVATKRTAIATGKISVDSNTFKLIKKKGLKKGDAISLAEIAGIQAAKKASDTILLCHPIIIDHIKVDSEFDENNNTVIIYALVSTVAKTGVEMEAISAVNAALITIYDLAKMYDPAPLISDIKLLMKRGGKKGLWFNPDGVPGWVEEMFKEDATLIDVTSGVVTMSDRASDGVYKDESGAIIKKFLSDEGSEVVGCKIIKDEKKAIIEAIIELCQEGAKLIITTGGTGVSKCDVTPEAMREISGRSIPGIGEFLRASGAKFTKHSWSSRSCATIVGDTLVINLAGSPKAVDQSLDCLKPIIPHLLNTIEGKKHD